MGGVAHCSRTTSVHIGLRALTFPDSSEPKADATICSSVVETVQRHTETVQLNVHMLVSGLKREIIRSNHVFLCLSVMIAVFHCPPFYFCFMLLYTNPQNSNPANKAPATGSLLPWFVSVLPPFTSDTPQLGGTAGSLILLLAVFSHAEGGGFRRR